MSKTDLEDLGELITPELVTYLGSGELNSSRLADSIDYSGLKIDDFDQLKKLHFVLYCDVVKYIRRLEDRLRRVKTEHRREREVTHGEVRGPVNWQRTLQKRPQTGDPALFVIDNPEIDFDIPENRVIKKLIAVIAEPLTEDIEGTDREWRKMWGDADIVNLQRILERNVYLDQIPDAKEISVSDMDITKARRSRHRLYSKGAELYRLYDDLLNDRYHREDVHSLFKNTIVTPTKGYVLFELFCVFAEIQRLRERYPGIKLQRVKPGMDEIAVLEGESRRVSVFYDQGGPLGFFADLPKSDELKKDWEVPEAIIRHTEALNRHETLIQEFIQSGSSHSYYEGRPDIVVAEHTKQDDVENLDRVRLGEVKYTRSESTFSTGLRELLEYIHLADVNDEYLFKQYLESDSIQGLIFTDGVTTEADTVDGITHYDTEDLRDLLE
jgi:hypothetical protein